MNSKKGKGKLKPHKPQNPNQPPKEEIDELKIENVTEITESAPKIEERVPEIISEVVTPAVECKDKEEDSPKKPKRNRGKKKKNEKDESDTQEGQTSENVEDVQLEIVEVETQEVIVEENVTPSARKKKNKNKKSDTEPKQPEKLEKGEPLVEIKSDEGEFNVKEETKSQDTGDLEGKTSKKKNKKKKQRNDSEKSDVKSEEISCTSAFQQLLKEEKMDAKLNIDTKKTSAEAATKEATVLEMGKTITDTFVQELEKLEGVKDVTQDTPKLPEPGNTNKKKNKKDKKELPKDTRTDVISEISLMTAIKPVTKVEHISKEGLTVKEDPLTEPMAEVPKAETDIKPKAKIAKPVERKRKGKGDKNLEETSSEIITEKDSEIKDISISDTEQKEVAQTADISKQIEITIKDEPKIPEHIGDEENKQTTKTSEKKRKGKGNKQSNEKLTETTDDKVIKAEPPTLEPKQELILENVVVPCQTEVKTEVIKEDTLPLPEMAKDVESKQEVHKPESKAEKKRKGKKDTKGQELSLEPTSDNKTDDKKLKGKELATPVSIVEEIFGITDISKEEGVKSTDASELIVTQAIESTEVLSQPFETQGKEKKDIDEQLLLESFSKTEVLLIKEEIPPEAKTEIAVKIVNIADQSQILKDIPTLPEPIENIQMQQEMAVEIETLVSKSDTEEMKETSFINLPESAMGKKRKKSPKPKHDHKTKMPELKAEMMSETTDSGKEAPMTPIKEEPKIEESLVFPAMKEPEAEIKDESEDLFNTMEPIIPFDIKTEIEDKTPFETKSKKKRKKSPKLPQQDHDVKKTGTSKESKPEKLESTLVKEEKTEQTKDTAQPSPKVEEKAETFYDLPSDIEISSLKADESEGSTCGFTPDIIQHPRATSQDLLDDNNNNTMIQEITIMEEAKLQIPIDIPDTPLIRGSGATPVDTPESVVVGIRISQIDVDTNKKEPEKTDIKSKMMEVNQDMEELRLSIERSLAELTAIEKSEDDVEKQFEGKKVVTEEPKPSEIKPSMPSEIIAKTHDKAEPQKDFKKGPSPLPAPKDSQPLESIIPPKTSMFFDKELKDVEIKPGSTQEAICIVGTPKAPDTIVDTITPPVPPARNKSLSKERDNKDIKMKITDDPKLPETSIVTESSQPTDTITESAAPPVCPARKDNKNKNKNKKKGKQEAQGTASTQSTTAAQSTTSTAASKDSPKESKKEEKTDQKSGSTQEKGKQQSDAPTGDTITSNPEHEPENVVPDFEPIESFEDAMTSSADDINKTFEMIANEASRSMEASHVNPEIKIVAPVEDTKRDRRDEKINPVSQPKNLLGHPDIPVRLNKTDYKKEKNKSPNAITAKVKIKDSVQIEDKKQTKDTQTENIRKFLKSKSIDESFSSVTNENDEFVYKYSFRKVFLQSACHVCKRELKQTRVPCNYCNLVFYCNAKHKDEDWPQHQGLCFAISTIVHLKDQKHIYADAKNVTGQDYRLLRMQMIVSCERVLKRKLSPWEQEALLYPRMCADAGCREWRQSKLQDCDGCGQISYCSGTPSHFPKSHQRWCKSYSLYQKLVCHQQTKGRLEPKLPSKVMMEHYQIPEKINEALATMYEEKIDMNDIQYAALTQIATAPLTAAYCHQTYAATSQANGTYKKTSCTVHIVGGELQFEADALNKWEVFFLHLRPHLQELRVVMIGSDLNPSELPLELLGKVKLCESCRANKRRVVFSFQDKTTYHDYRSSDDFISPDLVCAFNPSIKRSAIYNGKDHWPKTINCVLKQKTPFLVSSHTMNELQRDLARVKECSEVDLKVIIEPRLNSFASVRPDRNFISDEEMPLLFKNYCYMLVCGIY